MGATVVQISATRHGSKVRVEGTLETPQDGWSAELRPANPGAGGAFDKTLRLELEATAPNVGTDVVTKVPFLGTFGANDDDENVVVRLIDAVSTEGKDAVTLPL